MTVNAGPGLASLKFVFEVSGTFSGSGSGNALNTSAVLVAESCPVVDFACTGNNPPRNITQVPITANGAITVNLVPWILNQPFDYEFILAANAAVIPTMIGAQGYINGASTATTNFSDTAQLVAIYPVDSQGNLVPGTTITSASGFALPLVTSLATPEPSTLLVSMGGLLFLVWRRRSGLSC
jgi:hypothetical protein